MDWWRGLRVADADDDWPSSSLLENESKEDSEDVESRDRRRSRAERWRFRGGWAASSARSTNEGEESDDLPEPKYDPCWYCC